MSRRQSNSSIPHRSTGELKQEANKFLASYNKDNEIPVPIEYIADYNLGISVIPSKDLERLWGIDAFINSALDTIVIDNRTYMSQEERTRFSIAHEVAHAVLHREFYEKLEVRDEKSYLDFQEKGDSDAKKKMEIQAYIFAGYILLPEKQFNPRFESLFESLTSVDIDELFQIMRILSVEFQVSSICLRKQIEREFPDKFAEITALKEFS